MCMLLFIQSCFVCMHVIVFYTVVSSLARRCCPDFCVASLQLVFVICARCIGNHGPQILYIFDGRSAVIHSDVGTQALRAADILEQAKLIPPAVVESFPGSVFLQAVFALTHVMSQLRSIFLACKRSRCVWRLDAPSFTWSRCNASLMCRSHLPWCLCCQGLESTGGSRRRSRSAGPAVRVCK